MAETAAHHRDHVLPEVPIRQFVLGLPRAIRFLMARDPAEVRFDAPVGREQAGALQPA